MKKIITTEKAFTLIELMIVVAIIGVLSVIAIPTFDSYQKKAKQTEAKVALSGIYTGEKSFHAEYSAYIANLTAIGYSTPAKNYVVGFKTLASSAGTSENIAGVEKINPAKGSCKTLALSAKALAAGTTFAAEAYGDVGNGACDDKWYINQAKTVENKAAP